MNFNSSLNVFCGVYQARRRRGFTGHEHIRQFNLINMNARLYDPKIGKFFSPDNFIADPENSQGYNRYSYAYNNPLMCTDPTGNFLEGPFGNGGYSENYLSQRNYASYLYYQRGIDVFCGIRFNKFGQDQIDEDLDLSYLSTDADYYHEDELTPEEKSYPVYRTGVVEVVANRWTKEVDQRGRRRISSEEKKKKLSKYCGGFKINY